MRRRANKGQLIINIGARAEEFFFGAFSCPHLSTVGDICVSGSIMRGSGSIMLKNAFVEGSLA